MAVCLLVAGLAINMTMPVSAAAYSQQEAACRNNPQTLHPGDKGICVILAQKLLYGRGFLHATPNGVYGPLTAQAAHQLQVQAGYIPADQIGPRTWANLLGTTSRSAPMPPTASVANTGSVPAPCLQPGKVICIDKTGGSSAKLWALQDKAVVYGPVWATTGDGRGEMYKTLEGTRKVTFKDKNHLSKEFRNAPMPNSIFFTSNGEAIHAGSVSASHGCVHVSQAASEWLFNFAEAGRTLVTVTP